MRKMSKGLSFVLVLALVLGSFSMASAVAVKAPGDIVRLSDIAGVPGQEEIEVCQNLGIITGNPDGTFLPDKDVNRAEFAAIITRTMGIPESALAGFSTTSFQDTSGYGWAVPYLAYCHSKGIMLGDGYGNAMPGRTITVNEAMTMICRALGYVENSSNLTGTWPSNYITLAQNLWLYNNLDRNVKLMSKEMSAIAIYNALMVQKVAVASDGKTDLQWKVQPNQISNGEMANFLNTGLECRGDDETYLGSGDAVPGNSLISIIDKIGAYGMGYYTKNDELIAFKMADNFDLLTGYMDGNNFIAENGKKYAFNQSPTTLLNGVRRVFDNAVAETVASGGAIFSNAALTNVGDMFDSITDGWTDGDMLTLSGEVTGLTFRTVRAIVGWHATATDQLSSSDLRDIEDDSALFNSDFPLDYYSEIAERQVSFVGIEGLDDLAIDDVVYVYAEDDGDGPIRKVAASNETLEGTIDEISDADGDVFIVIDGDEYSFSADYLIIEDGASVNDVINDAGADCEALLDAYGNIYD
ncbi:MAG: S-layer homology domain-containing protein, partial [Clostridiales bacterium]|nr:S-layer homology domain-containing protein [Clostridiales bacterium]